MKTSEIEVPISTASSSITPNLTSWLPVVKVPHRLSIERFALSWKQASDVDAHTWVIPC